MVMNQLDRYENTADVIPAYCPAAALVPIETIYTDEKNRSSHFRAIRDSIRIYRRLLYLNLSSLSGFGIDYTLFALLTLFLPQTAAFTLLANVLARVVSGYCNYWINSGLVFHEKRSVRTAMQYFLLADAILLENLSSIDGAADV